MPPRPSQTSVLDRSRTSRSRPRPRQRRRSLGLWLLLIVLVVTAIYLRHRRSAPLLPPPATPQRVGIIAGHWEYDSGATCDDGLREVDITLPVASIVASRLDEAGYEAEVLPEYAERLRGYQALALVSIHADSCIPELSGYKVVGRSQAAVAASGELARCLSQQYAAASGLAFHENTITPDMVQYHAFHEVSPRTPAAIIELGFMGGDRVLLTVHQSTLAQGIADGLLEFLREQGAEAATPTGNAP